MFNYHAFGLNISSEIEFPGMLEATSDKIDVKIFRGVLSPIPSIQSPNFLVHKQDVNIWWEDIGKVKISGGKEITVDAKDQQIIPFLLGPVMAILLHQRGFLVLHGSAVKVKNRAVAFLGYRTFGKSTTAINLHKNGYPLVTDDILAINFDKKDKPIVYPGYPHVRLSEDSYDDIKDNTDILTPLRTIVGKIFCDASKGFSPEPLKLEKIYVLDKGEKIEIFSFNSQDNLMDLIRHSVASRIFSETDQAENLMQCAKLINNISIKGLRVNHSFKDLPELIKTISEDI